LSFSPRLLKSTRGLAAKATLLFDERPEIGRPQFAMRTANDLHQELGELLSFHANSGRIGFARGAAPHGLFLLACCHMRSSTASVIALPVEVKQKTALEMSRGRRWWT
jgi:hypothetical protein